MTTWVFGHQNPDTDAITSAISFSYLQNQLGNETEPVILGAPNGETLFALAYFNTEIPKQVSELPETGRPVMLVDHNEFQQSISGIEEAEILSVVDHHRIANFETKNPLFYRAEPVGCTNTIIYKLFKEHEVSIPKEMAGLMLSAIISDTLLFQSPTCTEEDKKIAHELAHLADVDLETYGLEMLKAGTNLSSKSSLELLTADAKTFPMGSAQVRIAQVNTVDVDEVLKRQVELETLMKELNEQEHFDLYVLVITNILTSDSVILAIGTLQDKVEEAFGVTLKNNYAHVPGVVSRKKQVVPPLTAAIAK